MKRKRLKSGKYIKKVWLSSLLLSGLVLSWAVSLNITVLGVDVTKRATFPTLATVGKINLLNFIQRLDAIVIFTLPITVFFKASDYLYAAVIGIVDLLGLENHHRFILPLGFVVIFLSLVVASNMQEHYKEGINGYYYYYYHIPLLFIITVVMLIVSFIKIGGRKELASLLLFVFYIC